MAFTIGMPILPLGCISKPNRPDGVPPVYGTSETSNFLGTTDNTSLVFKVNNQIAGKIDPVNSNTSLGYLVAHDNTVGLIPPLAKKHCLVMLPEKMPQPLGPELCIIPTMQVVPLPIKM